MTAHDVEGELRNPDGKWTKSVSGVAHHLDAGWKAGHTWSPSRQRASHQPAGGRSAQQYDKAISGAAHDEAVATKTASAREFIGKEYRKDFNERGLFLGAMTDYQRESSQINFPLRAGTPLDVSERDQVQRLDKVIETNKTKGDVVAYRGIGNAAGVFGDAWHPGQDPAGLAWVDDAYVSTSSQQSVGHAFAEGEGTKIRMRILVPKGTAAARADVLAKTAHESELLVGRGQTFHVVRGSGPDAAGIYDWDVEIIPGRKATGGKPPGVVVAAATSTTVPTGSSRFVDMGPAVHVITAPGPEGVNAAATIGLLAYGLRPSPLATVPTYLLASGAYSSLSWDLQMTAAHAGCHVSAFCRNPLHPGPCKGWKGHLGLVSPGALHALEKIRHEQLDKKRVAKVNALKAAGKPVPKHLLTPIVYDPAKNKHLQGGDKITPGLGIPTKGLTPEAAKDTLDKIPTKAQVGAKLDAKHAAEDAAAAKTLADIKAIIGGKHDGAPLSGVVGTFMKLSKPQFDGLTQQEKKAVVQRIALHHSSMVAHAGEPSMAGLPVGAADSLAKKYEELTGKPISDHAQVWKGLASKEEIAHVAEAEAATKKVVHPGGIQVGAPVKHPNSWGHHIVVSNNADGTSTLETAGKPGQGTTKVYTTSLTQLGGQEAKDALAAHETAKVAGKPTMLTVSKAGLKPGDKAFLHGQGSGEPQLVTVKKKSGGYEFVNAKGETIKSSGGTTKHALSPAPGESFPGAPAAPAAPKAPGASAPLPPLESMKKADAMAKAGSIVSGKNLTTEDKVKLAHQIAAKDAAGQEHAPKEGVDHMAVQIAGKLWKQTDVNEHVHQADLEAALKKDLHDGVNGGKDTPVLDAAKEALKTLGQGSPGADKKLGDAVAAKLGIGAPSDTPKHQVDETVGHLLTSVAQGDLHDPKHDNAVINFSHNVSKADFQTHLSPAEQKTFLARLAEAHARLDATAPKIGHPTEVHAKVAKAAAAYEKLAGKPMPKARTEPDVLQGLLDAVPMAGSGHAPHVKLAVDYANGFKAATDTKKLPAYQKLTPDELASLDPNTQKLMAANLAGMQAKFLKPEKQAAAGEVLAKLQKAQGGGVGAGGSSAVHTPTAAAVDKTVDEKAAIGSKVAAHFDKLGNGVDVNPGAFMPILKHAHETGKIDQVSKVFADSFAEGILKKHGTGLPDAAIAGIHPHLSAEIAKGLKGEVAPSPLAEAFHKVSTDKAGPGPVVDAIYKNPHLGPSVMGVSPATDVTGSTGETAQQAYKMASDHVTKTLNSLGLPKADKNELDVNIGSDLEDHLHKEYQQAIEGEGLQPEHLASQLDALVQDVNAKGDAMASSGSSPAAVAGWKVGYFESKIQTLLKSVPTPQAGAGGSSSHTSPTSSAIGLTDTIGHLSTPTKTALSGDFKSLPNTQLKEDPQHLFDAAVATASAHSTATSKVSALQVLQSVDEVHSAQNGWANAGLLEKKVKEWLQTPAGSSYAKANLTPKPDLYAKINPNFDEAIKKTVTGGPGKYDAKHKGPWTKVSDAAATAEENAYRQKHGALTKDQIDSIYSYTAQSSSVNTLLRTGKGGSPGLTQKINNIQDAMRPTQADQLLLRGTGWEAIPEGFRTFEGVKSLVGKNITDKAFMSTSIAGAGGHFSSKPVQIEFEAPKGTMGTYVNQHSAFQGTENELLLAAGTKWRITGVTQTSEGIQIKARIVS